MNDDMDWATELAKAIEGRFMVREHHPNGGHYMPSPGALAQFIRASTPDAANESEHVIRELVDVLRFVSSENDLNPLCEGMIVEAITRAESALSRPASPQTTPSPTPSTPAKPRKVVFVFDERSLESIDNLRAHGYEFIEVEVDGRTMLLPKLPPSPPSQPTASVQLPSDEEVEAYTKTHHWTDGTSAVLNFFDWLRTRASSPTKQQDDMAERLAQAIDLLKRAAIYMDEYPDPEWGEECYTLTGEHMIETEEGWVPGSMKGDCEDNGEEILDEVNAPSSAPKQPATSTISVPPIIRDVISVVPIEQPKPELPPGVVIPESWRWTGEVRKPKMGESFVYAGKIFDASCDFFCIEHPIVVRVESQPQGDSAKGEKS